MFYYLGEALAPYVSAVNVLTYITVRTGGAAITAFLVTLAIGPALIRRLQQLKIGQYIREEHVTDLHALHKTKAGTPTMGGTLIIASTVASLILWGRFTNELLLLATFVLCVLGGVGFLDDFIKIRRKHNLGLTAKAKFLGQIAVGLLVGLYAYYNPITMSATYVAERDVTNWRTLVSSLAQQGLSDAPSPGKRFWEFLPAETRIRAGQNPLEFALSELAREEFRLALNAVLAQPDLYLSLIHISEPTRPY